MAGVFISMYDVNKYLTDREPWKMKDEKSVLELCEQLNHAFTLPFFAPICPVGSNKMLKTLNVEMKPLVEISIGFDNLPIGQVIGTPKFFSLNLWMRTRTRRQ